MIFVGDSAWQLIVGGVNCPPRCDNERDLNLLNNLSSLGRLLVQASAASIVGASYEDHTKARAK
jgi:hypothetical protein